MVTEGPAEGTETSVLVTTVFFTSCLLLGGVLQWLVSKIRTYRPPISVVWFVAGMAICGLEIWLVPSHEMSSSLSSGSSLTSFGLRQMMNVDLFSHSKDISRDKKYEYLISEEINNNDSMCCFDVRGSHCGNLSIRCLENQNQSIIEKRFDNSIDSNFYQKISENSKYIPNRYLQNSETTKEVVVDIDATKPLGVLTTGIADAAHIHSSILYYVFLPILLYEATQNINWHHFNKSLPVGLILAGAGVFLQVGIIGVLIHYTFEDPVPTNSSASSLTSLIRLPSSLVPVQNSSSFLYQTLNDSHQNYYLPVHGIENKNELMGSARKGTYMSFSFSFMVASAVASTDPVAVLSILHSMEAPAKLGSFFEAESMINDGTSIFLFTFFKELTRGDTETWEQTFRKFMSLLLIGPAFGFAIASLMYRWLKHYYKHHLTKVLTVISVGYLCFYIAEHYLSTSGPLTIVTYGLYFKAFAKAAFEAETEKQHIVFVDGLVTAAASVVFIISGIASTRMIVDSYTHESQLQFPPDTSEPLSSVTQSVFQRAALLLGSAAVSNLSNSETTWHVLVFYLYLNFARFVMIGIFYPFINRLSGGFSWKESVLLSWGGLRGAVCLILGLIIEQDAKINPVLTATTSMYIASSAFLILFVNGLSFEFIYKLLRPYPPNPFRTAYLKKVLKLIDREYVSESNILQCHWLFRHTSAMSYADLLVPKLGESQISRMGHLRMHIPSVNSVMRSLTDDQLSSVISQQAQVTESVAAHIDAVLFPAPRMPKGDATVVHEAFEELIAAQLSMMPSEEQAVRQPSFPWPGIETGRESGRQDEETGVARIAPVGVPEFGTTRETEGEGPGGGPGGSMQGAMGSAEVRLIGTEGRTSISPPGRVGGGIGLPGTPSAQGHVQAARTQGLRRGPDVQDLFRDNLELLEEEEDEEEVEEGFKMSSKEKESEEKQVVSRMASVRSPSSENSSSVPEPISDFASMRIQIRSASKETPVLPPQPKETIREIFPGDKKKGTIRISDADAPFAIRRGGEPLQTSSEQQSFTDQSTIRRRTSAGMHPQEVYLPRPTPLPRIPGYRYDSVVRIRSEPNSALLDAARLERYEREVNEARETKQEPPLWMSQVAPSSPRGTTASRERTRDELEVASPQRRSVISFSGAEMSSADERGEEKSGFFEKLKKRRRGSLGVDDAVSEDESAGRKGGWGIKWTGGRRRSSDSSTGKKKIEKTTSPMEPLAVKRANSAPQVYLKNLSFVTEMSEDLETDKSQQVKSESSKGYRIGKRINRKDKETELKIMVLNSMRQMYFKMYEQKFVSGTVYMSIVETTESVIDFSIDQLHKLPAIQFWKEALRVRKFNVMQKTFTEEDQILTLSEDHAKTPWYRFLNRRAKRKEIENVLNSLIAMSPFELEWRMTAIRLRGVSPPWWRRAYLRCLEWYHKIFSSKKENNLSKELEEDSVSIPVKGTSNFNLKVKKINKIQNAQPEISRAQDSAQGDNKLNNNKNNNISKSSSKDDQKVRFDDEEQLLALSSDLVINEKIEDEKIDQTTFCEQFGESFRRFRVSLWNHIGPSLSFPALDDLQRLCAFVDVHEEMLLRGGESLEALLGTIMLADFKLNVERARFGVSILRILYPHSFPYALICHAAVFLLNMKMQLVEEQYERGLLLEDDKKFIVAVLDRQLVDVTKFCPPYLFS